MWTGDAAYVDYETYLYYWKSSIDFNATLARETYTELKKEKSN